MSVLNTINKLTDLGFIQNELDETTFERKNDAGDLIVALYVDDLFLTASNENTLEVFKHELKGLFDLKYFGEISEYRPFDR